MGFMIVGRNIKRDSVMWERRSLMKSLVFWKGLESSILMFLEMFIGKIDESKKLRVK